MKHLSTIIKNLALPCTAIITMAACSDYAPEEYEGNFTKEEYETILEYSKNFVNKYGKIDPQHNWGFEDMPVANDVESKKQRKTRLGWVDTNKNQWFDTNTGQSSNGITIPGLPSDVDGRYITSDQGGYNVRMHDSYTTLDWNQQIPAGDVTDEEILYVSEWFRTHPNPGTKAVKLNDFFIQEVSWDEDRVSYPNGAVNDKVNWNDQNGYPQSRNITAKMDQLCCFQNYKTDMNDWQTATHINNMNNGNTNIANAGKSYADLTADKTTCGTLFPQRSMSRFKCNDGDYVTSFSAWQSTDSRWTDRYVFVHLEFTGPASGKKYSGDYIAFDFGFNGKNPLVYDGHGNVVERQPDGYYSNWILKISPAVKDQENEDPSSYTRRVMCEDLGDTDDFDFNDLVFDVSFDKVAEGNYTANVTVRAVGGTLPIYIGTDMTQELHAAMGVDVKQPVNVGASNGVETSQTVTRTIYGLSAPNADLVPICVVRDGNKATLLPSTRELKSAAPTKICVPTTVKWMKERMDIQNNGYEKFGDYVGNRDVKFWESGNIQTDNLYE